MNISGLKEGDKIGHARIDSITRPKFPKIPGDKKAKGKAQRSHLAEKFADIWRVFGDCPYPMVEEYQFHPERKWRFDFAFPRANPPVSVELDGGVHTGGRHTRGKGFEADCEKINTATSMGWVVLRFTARDLAKKRQTATVDLVRKALGLT